MQAVSSQSRCCGEIRTMIGPFHTVSKAGYEELFERLSLKQSA